MCYRKHPQDSAQSETPGMYGNSTRENRETPSTPVVEGVTGRLEKAVSQKSNTHVGGESDGRVVPTKCPNNGGRPPAEGMEGRRPTKENIGQATAPRTQSRTSASSDLHGVREAASRDKRVRFTELLHHVTTKLLRGSFYALKRDAAPGVDGVTWQEYETDLDEKLVDLHRRIHRGTYRAQPSKRAYIPKADGRQRPLGIAALEDKIVQQAVVTVLNQIYEEDFLGFLLWVPVWAQPARCFGRAVGGADAEEGELDTRCRCSGLFRQPVPPVAGQVRRASCCRPEDTAPDPEVAEGGSIRGRGVVEDGSRDSTRISSLTAAGEHLPTLRIRPLALA